VQRVGTTTHLHTPTQMENLDYAKAHPEKLNLIRSKCSSPSDLMMYLEFIKCDMPDLKVITTFKSKDWMSFGAMQEQEFFFNRDEEDVPEDKRKDEYDGRDKAMLTEAQFNAVKVKNPSTTLTYPLYVNMRAHDYPIKIRRIIRK